jgi:hypothetical protein
MVTCYADKCSNAPKFCVSYHHPESKALDSFKQKAIAELSLTKDNSTKGKDASVFNIASCPQDVQPLKDKLRQYGNGIFSSILRIKETQKGFEPTTASD